MNPQFLASKIQMLPEYLQREALDFVDYLLLKQNKKTKSYPDLSEEEMGENIELSAVNDSEEDYLTEKEIQYYLNLKDDH